MEKTVLIYAALGFIIVSNLSLIFAVIKVGANIVWKFSDLNTKVEALTNNSSDDRRNLKRVEAEVHTIKGDVKGLKELRHRRSEH